LTLAFTIASTLIFVCSAIGIYFFLLLYYKDDRGTKFEAVVKTTNMGWITTTHL